MLLAVSSAYAAPADTLRTLLEQGKPDEAYRTAKMTPGELGNPPFDFYFGVAAVNAGKASEGVLALERYLLNFPANQAARLELARGYFLLADDGRARDEFDAILAASPAPDAAIATVVREYLAAIAAREARHKAVWGLSIELGGGRDSNLQSGVADPNISLPVFGDITLADTAVGRGDRFANLMISAHASMPLRTRWSANWSLFAQAAADLKQYRDYDTFDQNLYSAVAGLAFNRGPNLVRMSLGAGTQTLDGQRYRDTFTLSTDYGRQLSANGVLTLGTQFAKFAYAGDNALRDANYYSLQGGYRHLFGGAMRAELDASLSIAREDVTREGFDALSRNLVGGRLGATVKPWRAWTLGTGATTLKSNYRAADELLMVTRRDRYSAFDLSIVYALSAQWSMRVEYLISRNRSNLPLFAYRRDIGQLKLRYDFR